MRRFLRSITLALALGVIVFSHRYWNGQWWTDIWDVEYPNIWTFQYTIPGYYASPW